MIVKEYLRKDRTLHAASMDLEKAYNRVDKEVLWSILMVYGVGGWLLKQIKSFDRATNTCVKVNGELSDSSDTRMGVRQGCVMSPWLFNIFMDDCMREMKAKVGNIGARLKLMR